ncbi:STAS domain-containing protein [Nocardia sp. NPDC052566]|uniref:STAS domain-containing protein n=1 Tax=Nocardia sp. NPDC052566 TaxID=3364330 RepID=UPI0037C6B771
MSAIAVLRHRNDAAPPHAVRAGRRQLWAHRIDRRHHCIVVRIEGELDAAVYPEFRTLLDRALNTPCHAVVIDLRAATFVSIRAAATLAPARDYALNRGVDLRVVTGRREVERALEVTGVRSAFCHYPTMRAALDA